MNCGLYNWQIIFTGIFITESKVFSGIFSVFLPFKPRVGQNGGVRSYGNNFLTDWAKLESQWRHHLDPGDRAASFEVGRVHLWHHCDVVLGEKKRFSRRLGKPVASIQTATKAPSKHIGNKLST